MKMRTKVYLISFSSSIIPLLLLAIITFNLFKDEITKSEREKVHLVLHQGESYLENTFINLSSKMDMLGEVYMGHESNEMEEYIDIFSKNTNEVEYFIFGDSEGNLYTGSSFPGKLPDTYDPRIRPWYIGALTTKESYFISDIFLHASTGSPVISISKRIEKNSKTLGVVSALLKLEILGESLGRFTNDKVTGFLVADSNGLPLFCVEDGNVHVDNLMEHDTSHEDESFHHNDSESIRSLPDEYIHANFDRLISDGYLVYSSPNGNEIYYPHLIEFAGLSLVGGVHEKELLKPVIKAEKIIFIISFTTMIVSTIIIIILGNKFSASMIRLSYIIDNIARGNYTKNLKNLDKYIDVDSELYPVKEGIERMQGEIKKREKKLKLISQTDSLTNIFNKGAITDILNIEIERSKSFGSKFTLIMFDLDHFKNLNDNFGHIFGDEVLKSISKTVLGQLKEGDSFGRYGGEEFLILLPDTNIYGGVALAERVRRVIESLEWKEKTITTASFGVAEFNAPKNFEMSVSIVDGLLYQAKKNGRNQVAYNK